MPEMTEADVNNALASLRSLASIGDEAVRDQATRNIDDVPAFTASGPSWPRRGALRRPAARRRGEAPERLGVSAAVWERGVPFWPYLLTTEQGEVLGLDARTHGEIVGEWLEKARRSASRDAACERARMRADILNDLVFERKREEAPEFDPLLQGDEPRAKPAVSLDDVTPPPVGDVAADEVLRLAGLESGYGVASVLASEIVAISRAWGVVADELCRGALRKNKKGRASR
jgi:hypothetical protein